MSLKYFCFIIFQEEQLQPSANNNRDYLWKSFTLEKLCHATNNFHEDNKIVERGVGDVYRGRTSKGVEIAVKRLTGRNMNVKLQMEFAVKVEILGRVRHKNQLELRGFHAGAKELLIVYDYMPNHSLNTHLHCNLAADCLLDLPKRMNIALGAAEGLANLHYEANSHIIHIDIKASNIEFEAKIVHFGSAMLVPEGVTTTMVKTLGYFAPEYAMLRKVSKSCDVYSFGILVLEIISGKKPIEKLGGRVKPHHIVEWVIPYVKKGVFNHIADTRLKGKFDPLQLKSMVTLAIRYTDSSLENQPSVVEVVDWLKEADPAGRSKKEIPNYQNVRGISKALKLRINNMTKLILTVKQNLE
ncbi:Pti1-like kinase [Quillaja saponaria]|uniref:Pti1-like kinase n=1 Tax=Quillaja saponaria TaxID=32244 RepID=A0AAD7Q672_QUISA|nr:Pti1-like kinase [Quillaja saponaria]